jgi:superfamily II DNA or RNA helicase
MDKPKLTGDIIKHWLKLAKGKRTVGYAVNVKHSLHMVEQFNAEGIRAAHLDGGTDDRTRVDTIRAFAAGELEILFNVGLFGEGFDLSAIAQRPVTIDCAILANPTNSLSKYLQESMRPMRPAPGKVAVILDHAGNSARHGFPDDEREWDLEGRAKRGKTQKDDAPPPPLTCDGCFRQIKRPLPDECPGCGKRLLANTPLPTVADGELHAVTEEEKKAKRAERKREEAEAKDLQALVALAAKRGYKNPQKWAFNKWSNSSWR